MDEMVICTDCGAAFPRFEWINGENEDWSNEGNPTCPSCRGIQGQPAFGIKHDVLGGFPWKRDANGRKVPK
jgi:hypothetical protein